MKYVNEETTSYVTATFKDKDGNAAVPLSANYTVHDLASGAELVPETALSPASSIEITMTPTVNTLQDQDNELEHRVVTVTAAYSGSDTVKDEYIYAVKNLRKVT